MGGLRITSWNGESNPFAYQPWTEKRTYQAMFDILEADILVMQETKIQRKDLQDDMVLVPGWDVYFSLPRHKKGYAGVAIYTRNSACIPIRAEEGITGTLCPPNTTTKFRHLPEDSQIGGYPRPGQLKGVIDETTLDSEGRCVLLEFPAFVLVGTYCPATRDETRDDFRLGFLDALDVRIRNLVAMGKNVVLAGDLNVIRAPIDTAHSLAKEGAATEEFVSTPLRRLFNQLLFAGEVREPRDEGREDPVLWDLGRLFNPCRQGMFTCWETKKNHRPGNFGSRIDYVLCSDAMKGWFQHSTIQEGLMGSDHCPVYATLSDIVQVDGKEVHIKDLMNPPGVFQDGERLREWTNKDLLPTSAKLIPEFDRRRNIKDMFSRNPAVPKSIPVLPKELLSDAGEGPLNPAYVAAPESNEPSSSHGEPSKPTTLPGISSSRTLKRTPSTSSVSNRPQKKAKATLAKEPSQLKGQSSLKGFFKPRCTTNPGTELSDIGSPASKNSKDVGTPSHPETVFDPIESKESWSKLLGKRIPPKCEHGEDCVSLITKKPGVNKGRSFYICGRPVGPSGEKESGTQWRCGTFIWSSDWMPPRPG
ncbi:DNase I-like protein [Xylariomycetidae sp. FL2044]|nr:DNase I-like protein [Xylariomycetidae sp. FL2044]